MSEDHFDQCAGPSSEPEFATVTVEGPGISITRPVDEATMSSVIALLFGAAPASLDVGGGGGGRTQRQGPRAQSGGLERANIWDEDLTLGEFIVESEAKTFSQKICAAGYYLISFQNKDSFSRGDVKAALANAHEDMPGNFTRDFSSAASSHLIAAKSGDAGQYYVPRTGRTAVESHFRDVPKSRNAKRATRKTATSSTNEESK